MAYKYIAGPCTPDYTAEPVHEGLPGVPATTFQLIQAFRWYNDNLADTKAAEFLKTDLTTAKRFMTLAWCERLVSRGFTFPEKEQATYLFQKAAFDEHVKVNAAEKEAAPKIDIRALIKQKAL